MKWGFFTPVHFVTLALAILMIIGLHFLLRRRSQKTQKVVLGVLSFSGIAAIVYNLLMWGSPLEYLPLHLCSLNALMLPVAVFTRDRRICNLLLVWCLGALAALILNVDMADTELMSWPFVFYYFPHVLETGIPVLLFSLGLAEKTPKCILSTMGITLAVYTAIHFVNVGINNWCAANSFSYNGTDIVSVNYMFSVQPTNPLLQLFHQIIPGQYWYMYLVFPIVLVYLLIVYAPDFIRIRKIKV